MRDKDVHQRVNERGEQKSQCVQNMRAHERTTTEGSKTVTTPLKKQSSRSHYKSQTGQDRLQRRTSRDVQKDKRHTQRKPVIFCYSQPKRFVRVQTTHV
ncbi:thymidylate synthase [Apis mellifera filamentous virus]|nr:thymidylate synthase [Apis mellifera filamentous virus]